MKQKHLEHALSALREFASPQLRYEQYVTPAHLASAIANEARARGDVEHKFVIDLGCGCGALAIACALCDAQCVLGVDVDVNALAIARENVANLAYDVDVEFIAMEVRRGFALRGGESSRARRADTVVMNPPFGTRAKGIDLAFIRAAFEIATTAVYSLHKTSTRTKVGAHARALGGTGEVVARLRYDLPATYGHHKEESVEIAVDLWRFEPPIGGVRALDAVEDAYDGAGEDDDGDGGRDDDEISRDFSRKANVSGRGAARGRAYGRESGRARGGGGGGRGNGWGRR